MSRSIDYRRLVQILRKKLDKYFLTLVIKE
jgi:hypothetical protein